MERTDRRRALLVIERVLLVIAVIALGWYAAVSIVSRLDQASQNRALDALRQNAPASTPAPSDAAPSSTPPPAPRPRPSPRGLVGRIEAPRIGLSAIVREGVDDETLRRAVGHLPETALPGEAGNAALAAHRDTFFRPLKNIRKGDRITVTTPDGVHEYRVSETLVVSPDDVSVLAPTSNATLTLVTCYPFNFVGSAPKRFIVRAEAPVATASVVSQSAAPQPALSVSNGVLPVRTGAVISEPERSGHSPRTAPAKPARQLRAKAPAKPAEKKAGPFRKFLQLFKGRPEASSPPSQTSRRR
jgi:sortase A